MLCLVRKIKIILYYIQLPFLSVSKDHEFAGQSSPK